MVQDTDRGGLPWVHLGTPSHMHACFVWHAVTVAESGTEALEVLRKAGPGAFQLILTDVIMPEVDGLELLRYVRSHQYLSSVPVVSELLRCSTQNRVECDVPSAWVLGATGARMR